LLVETALSKLVTSAASTMGSRLGNAAMGMKDKARKQDVAAATVLRTSEILIRIDWGAAPLPFDPAWPPPRESRLADPTRTAEHDDGGRGRAGVGGEVPQLSEFVHTSGEPCRNGWELAGPNGTHVGNGGPNDDVAVNGSGLDDGTSGITETTGCASPAARLPHHPEPVLDPPWHPRGPWPISSQSDHTVS
jgi:hypothetical protein